MISFISIQYKYTVKYKNSTISKQLNLTCVQFKWPLDRKLSGATTQDQSGTGSDGNEGVPVFTKSPSLQMHHH